jgi:hypothetical protein
MRYALIKGGSVSNIIWLYPGNTHDFPNAVPCEDVPVSIGDTYDGKVFYRDGKRVMSAAEENAEALRILLGEV